MNRFLSVGEVSALPRVVKGSRRRRRLNPGYPILSVVVAALAVLPCAVGPLSPRVASAQEDHAGPIRARLDQLREAGSVRINDFLVHRSDQLAQLYTRRGYVPIWNDARLQSQLVAAITDVSRDGLNPDDYGLSAIHALRMQDEIPADLDLLLSDALIRLSHDLRHGKVRANDPGAGRDLTRPLTGTDPVADLERMLAGGNLHVDLQALRPNHYIYRGLFASLENFRRIEAAGSWEPVPAGPTLRLGDTQARVVALRRRMLLLGDLPGSTPDSGAVYDDALEAAVRSYQRRHALNPDGIVGPATQRELDVTLHRRIEQVRVNLERARWLTPGLPETFVAVNIAGAMAYMVRENVVVWESRGVVGRTNTSTPVFQATMRTIELNPTWTVPPGIVGEVLADAQADPMYLTRNSIRVLDRNLRPVSVTPEELARYTSRTFPYVFRQDPGPANPLGDIKLLFPNPYNVYLHDTPSRSLFEREERTFSHGCIRLQDPIGLAEAVLNDPRWTRETITAEIAKGGTRAITLRTPLPVLVLYWTAATDESGELHFYRDVYGRDTAVLRALEAPG